MATVEKPKIPIHHQGKVVVEPGEVGLLVMYPDGQVEGASSTTQAISKAKAWFKGNVDVGSAGIGMIEWRGGCGPKTKGVICN